MEKSLRWIHNSIQNDDARFYDLEYGLRKFLCFTQLGNNSALYDVRCVHFKMDTTDVRTTDDIRQRGLLSPEIECIRLYLAARRLITECHPDPFLISLSPPQIVTDHD